MGTFRFKLPDIGEGVVEAEITAWHVALGDTVAEDQPIADAMTDKATIELTSPVDGVITKMACEEGEMLAVGADLVVLKTEGGEDEAPEPMAEDESEEIVETKEEITPLATAIGPKPTTAKPEPPAAPVVRSQPSVGKVMAPPAVRRRAEAMGLDLSDVPAAGVRHSHADLDAYLTAGKAASSSTEPTPKVPATTETATAEKTASPKAVAVELAEGETRIKVIGLRRVISQRMQEAKRNIPHFTYVEEIDVTALEALRTRINNKKAENKPKLTVLPLLIRALAVTLKDWPQFNARYMDGSAGLEGGYVSQFKDLNLGIAAQTDLGLIVPVLKKAQSLTMWQMAEEIARLSEAARTNSLDPEDLKGATTTLTSLGPLGGIVTTPVINRPEVAIFGPNKIRTHLVLEDGKPVERRVMNFSISCDHRVIDGYDAAKMMQDLKAKLEDPTSIFLM